MKKLKLQPLANAKKLSRKELKNIFGGFTDDDFYGSGNNSECNSHKDCPAGLLCGIYITVKKNGEKVSQTKCM